MSYRLSGLGIFCLIVAGFIFILCLITGRREIRYFLKNTKTKKKYACYYVLTLFSMWLVGLIDPILSEESPENLSVLEGTAYNNGLGKGISSFKINTNRNNGQFTPSFDFSLVDDNIDDTKMIGKTIRIWYKQHGIFMGGKGFIYQIAINNKIIFDIAAANAKIDGFNRKRVPVSYLFVSAWWLYFCIWRRSEKVNKRYIRLKKWFQKEPTKSEVL